MNANTAKIVSETVGKLLAHAAKAHFWHLETKSYAQHMALGELYGTLHDIADSIAESAQGDGMKLQVPAVSIAFTSCSAAITETEALCGAAGLGKILLVGIQGSPDLDWFANIIQEGQGTLYKILYKLKNLS